LPSIADLVERAKAAVASISVESVTRGLFFDFPDEGAGTGIVVRSNGYVVTNFHVIQDASGIKVDLTNGETYDARVVGRDVVSDLAVLKISAENLPTATFGNSNSLSVGDWVVTLGNALALKGGPTVTLGIVSARGRTVNTERGSLYDMIQTDAAINAGNSGGPMINLDGEVVGINTAILRQAQGIGFAISSAVAGPIIDSLIEHGRVVRPLIGLNGQDVTPAIANRLNLNVTEGIIITRMSRDGPAFRAGIRVGDVISKIDGIPTPDMARFLTLLWSYEVGDEVETEYISNNEYKVTMIELTERPTE
jgi:serine protease Do